MTTGELIQELLKLDPTTIVAVDQGDDLFEVAVVVPGGLVRPGVYHTTRLLAAQADDTGAAHCVVLS